ncbi:MAG TPA: hypothetical protein GXX51_05485 [Firmicutes bacterium]|nr:hypothetical protein [Bacillota bacterium]
MLEILSRDYGIDRNLLTLSETAITACQSEWARIESTGMVNFLKVLKAFQEAHVGDDHFAGTTGYGYDDIGREGLERAWAKIFGAEKALVRWQVVSGTHALSLCLFGLLRPGDRVVFATGAPYDTLHAVFGMDAASGSGGPANLRPGCLAELGITWKAVDMPPGGCPDIPRIVDAMDERTRLVFIQRSRGYAWRPSLSVRHIGKIASAVKAARADAIVLVDNCYGEFVETLEPPQVGADVIAGSLIKNPGGGIAPTGGYIAGRAELVERIATRLTAPGIGGECGPTLGITRLLLQGLFLAPRLVREALKGAAFVARFFSDLGFEVMPRPGDERSDLVQGILLGNRERVVSFCRGLQLASPVNAHFAPEPAPMPGYENEIIMGGGTFIQGSSSELSADAPIRPPYAVFMQGGLCFEHVMIGALLAANRLLADGLLDTLPGRNTC